MWLPTRDGRLLYLPSWDIARAMGLSPTAQRVSDSLLSGYDTSASLGWFITCVGTTSFINDGLRYPVSDTAGFASVSLDDSLCAAIPSAGNDASPIYIKSASSPAVFRLIDGARRYVPTMAKLMELSGGVVPKILTVPEVVFSAFPAGAQYFVTGELVKTSSSPEVYLFDGQQFHYVPSFSMVSRMGLSTAVRTASGWTPPSGVKALVSTVVCDGIVYEPRGGVLYPTGNGISVADTLLDTLLCEELSTSS